MCRDVDIFDANRDPELATAWTKRKAIANYEKFRDQTFDTDLYHDTLIEIVAKPASGSTAGHCTTWASSGM